MNRVDICIWNREFTLPVYVEEFEELNLTKGQIDALPYFLENRQALENAVRPLAEYLCRRNVELKDVNPEENLFRYVMPRSIFIPSSEQRIIAIMCDYKYDMEHGIALVFENEVLKEIGPQDIIL